MIYLPAPPQGATREIVVGNSDPIDVLGDRDGLATLTVFHYDPTDHVRFVFSATDELVDADEAPLIPPYAIVSISKQTRFMTLWTPFETVVHWYVV